MSPDIKVYEKIYDGLGDDFFNHLENSDLHYYTTNDGRTWINTQSFYNTWNFPSTTKSIEAAKAIIVDRYIQQTKATNPEDRQPSITPLSDVSEVQKVTLLFEITKIAAMRRKRITERYLSSYGIMDMDPNQRFEIAKIAAAEEPWAVSNCINSYSLNLSQRFEIAKIVAAHNKWAISELIGNFDLSHNQRFEIAKIVATEQEIDKGVISKFISNYNLDSVQRFEIAKIAAAKNGSLVSQFIANYNITDSTQRFEIAKISAKNSALDVSKFIEKYNLNSNQRFEIAKIAAAESLAAMMLFFICYDIRDSTQHFEIAKIAALHHGLLISEIIHVFDLDQTQLFEIVKMVTTEDMIRTSALIQSFQDPTIRSIRIKILAAEIKENYSTLISKCSLGPAHRFEIAKIIATHNGHLISELITTFNLFNLNDAQRLEIAKIVAAQDPWILPQFMIGYNFNLIQRLEIAKIIAAHHWLIVSKEISKFIDEYNIRDIEEFTQNPATKPFYEVIKPIQEELYNESNPYIRNVLIELWENFFIMCLLQNIPLENVKDGYPIVQELFSMREPSFRTILIPHIIKFLIAKDNLKLWEELFGLTKNKSYTGIMCMFLAPMTDETNKKMVADIIKTRTFQDTTIRYAFIRDLEKLARETNFSSREKRLLLHNFILQPPLTTNSLLLNTQQIAFLLVLGHAELLRTAIPKEGINTIINKHFQEHFGLTSIENFSEKFFNTFGSFRRPDAIYRYASTLMQLRPPEYRNLCMNVLRDFVTSVLEKTFLSLRYQIDDTELSLHLRTIFRTNSAGQRLEEQWKAGASYTDAFTPELIHQRQETTFNTIEFFQTKILNEQHLLEDKYPELFAVLRHPEERDRIKKTLEVKLKDKTLSSLKDIQNKKIMSFQVQVIKLMYPDQPLSNQEMEDKLTTLLKTLKSIYHSKQSESHPLLEADLDMAITSLKSLHPTREVAQYADWVVKDTDDPCDLLLLGTEIAGSCQHVDNPLSVALLSYLLDGKNRAVVVLNSEGIIVARTILRILWDKQANKPILLQELIYPEILPAAIVTVMNNSCKRRARELGLPLLSNQQTGLPYPNSVESLGGRAPFECVDEGVRLGMIRSGPWQLTSTYYADLSPEAYR